MKKSVIALLLLGVLLIPSSVLAQERVQTYSGFDKFIDNVRMLFSFGDKKVMLALDIREKELNSAIVHTKNGDDEAAERNLERARKKLQYVQNKVSKSIAEDVKTNTYETINKVGAEGNLPDSFEIYVLEEEKTQLTAELVVEVEENEVRTKAMEIETRIDEIDIQIAERTVKEGKNQIDTPSKTKDNEDVTPTPNVIDDEVDDTFVGPDGPGPGVVDED